MLVNIFVPDDVHALDKSIRQKSLEIRKLYLFLKKRLTSI